MRKRSIVVTAAAFLVFAGIAHGQMKTNPTLNKMAVAFAAAYNSGDAAKVAALYAEDAVAMPPNEPSVKGRAAIEARLKREFQADKATVKFTPLESAIIGDRAYEAGTATITLAGGGTMTEKYLTVFKKVGTDWKIAHDIWNSDAPPPPQKK